MFSPRATWAIKKTEGRKEGKLSRKRLPKGRGDKCLLALGSYDRAS